MSKKTVHVIANSHIDPVWLWNKQSGIDEILNTCETMVNLLDKHADFKFTAAEAYRYHIIEKLNPKLFGRIKERINDGRWELIGGWWMQPDCNAPTYEGFLYQLQSGYDYVMKTFGFFPEIGYNVDSFGHSAILPKLMNEFGQKYYAFMRPSRQEFPYPHNLFRWQGSMGGELTAFRITGNGYAASYVPHLTEQVPDLLKDMPEGVNNVAFFFGAGDHGGGPTIEMIEYIRANKNYYDNVEIKCSTLKEFFASIEKDNAKLAVHKGDLQLHAVGCYSVKRDIKTKVRETEQRLTQLNEVTENFIDEKEKALKMGKQVVAFSQFHDILGGTSIQSAYDAEINHLGGVVADVEDILNNNLRVKIADIPPYKYQRLFIDNKSAADFNDYVEIEPWLTWQDINVDQWKPGEKLIDLNNNSEIDYQLIKSEQVNTGRIPRLLFKQNLKRNETAIFALDTKDRKEIKNDFIVSESLILHSNGNTVDLKDNKIKLGKLELPLPSYDYIPDLTDNWSHDIDRFDECNRNITTNWNKYFIYEEGPIRGSILRKGSIGSSSIDEFWRVYQDGRYIELKLKINWQAEQTVLKYTMPLKLTDLRLDGIAGGTLNRENDGVERPFHYFTIINDEFSILSPDLFAFDVDEDKGRLRLTLLRNPVLTRHDPEVFNEKHAVYADTGIHTFKIRFTKITDPDILRNMAETMQRPLVFAETTRGMTRK